MATKTYRTVIFTKEDAQLLKSTSRRLGFSSISSYVMCLHSLRLKNSFSKLDLELLATLGLETFNKINKSIVVVSAKNDEEAMEQLGLKDAKKIADSEGKQFTEKIGPIEILVAQNFEEKGPKIVAKVVPKTEKRIVTLGKVPLVISVENKPEKTIKFTTSDPEKFNRKLDKIDFTKDRDVTLNFVPKKKKSEKEKKKTVSTEKMPTSDQFFKTESK